MKKKYIIISVILVPLLLIIGGVIWIIIKVQSTPIDLLSREDKEIEALLKNLKITNSSPEIVPIDIKQKTYIGTVFLKGYKTPSESWGIFTEKGQEIGMGKYDSMKERLRPYIGKKIKVTFKNVCRSATPGCCYSIFHYCGEVESWQPLE